MIGEDKLREKLLFDYKVSVLYLKSGASSSILSVATEIPLSTVKGCTSTIGKRVDDYVRLLPELGTKEELLTLQKQIDEHAKTNKQLNKWNNQDSVLSSYSKEIEEIKSLYSKTNQSISEETKRRINNLRMDGWSMRRIAEETGVSLGTVSGIVNAGKGKK